MMSGGLIDKVFIGLDNAPAAFDIKGRILGPVSFASLYSDFLDIRHSRLPKNNLFNFVSEWH